MTIIGASIDPVRIDGSLDQLNQDLQAYEKIGIKAVELPVHGLDAILNGTLNPARTRQVISLVSDFDFCYSIHSPNPVNLMDKRDPALHKAVLLASLEFARQIRATVVVVHSGRFIPEEDFAVTRARSLTASEQMRMLDKEAQYLQEIADQYPDILIALENARPYLSQSPYTYAERLEPLREQILRVDRDNVKINLDVGHLFMASRFYQFDPVAAVKTIQDLVVHAHVHDNFGGTVHHWEKQQTHQLPFGRGDSHMPVGFGRIPIQAILEILLPDFDGLLIMELRSRYFFDTKTSLDSLSALVAACNVRQCP
ncbi:MAG TPA: sugar phosphate isomerase/epimerase [Desulfotignum sp.]|jgi:sugar phosphate isomerase/epimerase|nr:sugar phosphate isomerase/epimerase [Desulfotignum sp.]